MLDKRISIIIVLLIALTTQLVVGQRIRFDKDKLAFLKNTEKVNVVFNFNDTHFNSDNISEKEFIAHISEKIKNHGDTKMVQEFLIDFENAKKDAWPNQFVNTLNKWTADYKNAPTFAIGDPTAMFTMRVNSTWMYFGYDVSIVDSPSKASMDIVFYKSISPDQIIESTSISRAMGTYNKKDDDGEMWPKPNLNRMAKAYDRAAYKFAKAIKRVVD